MDASRQQALENLRRELAAGRVVVFAGAGCSVEAGYPLWTGLLEGLSATLGVPDQGESDYLDRASTIKTWALESGNDKTYYGELEAIFGIKPCTEGQQNLVTLSPRGLVTTNFEITLSSAVAQAAGGHLGHPVDLCGLRRSNVLDFLQDLTRSDGLRRVLHLHGVYNNPDHIVLTRQDFELRYGVTADFGFDPSRSGPVSTDLLTLHRRVLYALLSTHAILFVGFSFSDPFLNHILRVIPRDFDKGNSRPLHFALLKEPADEVNREAQNEQLAAAMVAPIYYEDPQGDHSEMWRLVGSLAAEMAALPSGGPVQPDVDSTPLVPAYEDFNRRFWDD